MAVLLAPTPLPTTSVDVDTIDAAGIHADDPHGIVVDYDYLRSLITGKSRPGGTRKQSSRRVFCVGLPDIATGVPRSIGGYRSLSEPALHLETKMAAVQARVEEENAIMVTAPGSPPDLSSSKSSKSSASSISDGLSENESMEKLSQFEDVTLDGERRDSLDDCNVKPESRPTLRRPSPRSATLPHPKGYPSLRVATNVALREQPPNLHNGRSGRRGFTSPASPGYMMHAPRRLASRSPSPNKPLSPGGVARSAENLGSSVTTSPLGVPTSPNGSLSRSQSWQPNRKTAKELEAEYKDDGDDEVPEEAILENVPISPMPGMPREKTPSPHRPVSQPQLGLHSTLHSARVPKNAKRPSAPPLMPNGQYGSSRSPRHSRPPTLPHSATVASFPPEPFHRRHKSKSWTEDLNEEARQLSAALDEYNERLSSEKLPSGTNSASSSPPRPSFMKLRPRTSLMELPPVQKGSVMIDPLPISKEKEAVLTRTRPSWLPPKCQKEEKKHLKEWEQMMARAANAAKKRELKLQEQAEDRVERRNSLARIWDEHVLLHWETMISEPRTRELWWSGVAPKSRGVVWQKAIGNELGLQPMSFEAALRRANEVEEQVAEMTSEERRNGKEAAWFAAIERDVPTVFPELDMFQNGAPLHQALGDVLKAYATYRADVGYVYGTHLVAGILCMHLPPADAFVALANLFNRALPLAFLVHDRAAMSRVYESVLSTLRFKFPHLHSRLTAPGLALKPEEYLDPMFRSLFAYNLPPEHVCRVWDIFIFEGDKALVRAAVAALGRLEAKLYGPREDVLGLVGWRNEKRWDVGSEEDFIRAVREAGKVDGKGEVVGV